MTLQNSVILPQNDSVLLVRTSILHLVDFDHIAALFVNQVLYWQDKMHREFYKTDQSFADELHVSVHKFRRIKQRTLKKLDFISTHVKQIPARTHYQADIDLLNAALSKLELEENFNKKAQKKQNISPKTTANANKSAQSSLCKSTQTSLSKSAHTITETKTEITKKTTTEKISTGAEKLPTEKKSVVVDLQCFTAEEQPAAQKQLSKLTNAQQLAVIAVLHCAIRSKRLKNKIGYLHAVVKSVLDGTFTPALPSEKVLTAEEKIQRKKAEQVAEAQRDQLAKQQYAQQIAAYQTAQAPTEKQTKPKSHKHFPLHGLLRKMRS